MAETCSRIDDPADKWLPITTTFCERYGLTARRRKSALHTLEAAGIIRVERSSKRAPRVMLIPWQPNCNHPAKTAEGRLSRRVKMWPVLAPVQTAVYAPA
jgi:hypothetical protein